METEVSGYAALINRIDAVKQAILIRRIDIAKQTEIIKRIEAIEQALGDIHPSNQALLSSAKNSQNPKQIVAKVNAAVVKEFSLGRVSNMKTVSSLCVDLDVCLRL